MSKKKSLPTCTICYNTFKKAISPCKCLICETCWTQIIITKMKFCVSLPEKIICPTIECQEELSFKRLYKKLPRHLKLEIDQGSLNIYLAQTPDIRRCPSPGCNYAGIIDLSSSCSENLTCNDCGTTWRDKVHYNKTEEVQDYIYDAINNKNEFFSAMWKRWKTKKCPCCQVLIEKDDGCDHMTCIRCEYEFCWTCLEKDQCNQSIHHNIKLKICLGALFLAVCFTILYMYYLFCANFLAPETFVLPAKNEVSIWTGRWIGGFVLLGIGLHSAVTLHDKIVYNFYAWKKRFYVGIILACLLVAYYFQLLNHIVVLGGIGLAVVVGTLTKEVVTSLKRQTY